MSTNSQDAPAISGNKDLCQQNAENEDVAPVKTEPETAVDETVEEPQTKSKPKAKLCGICEKQEGRYKCPRCSLQYCSVACFRTHKENHPPDTPKPSPPPQPTEAETDSNSTSRKRSAHPFSVLDDSPELAQLFRRYPSLPSKLSSIHNATLPPKEEQPSRGGLPWNLQQAPGYQPGYKKPRWTHDTGLRRGKEALRKARTDPGEDGDAVREYCELVLYLLSKDRESTDVTDLVRRQVTQEDVKLIEQLIEAEERWS